jgi:N-acetylglucosamine kinase-like BadF-type ATPase
MCHWAELNRNGVIANAEDNNILYSVVLRDKAFLLWSKAVARFAREGDKVSRVILDRFFTCLAERGDPITAAAQCGSAPHKS